MNRPLALAAALALAPVLPAAAMAAEAQTPPPPVVMQPAAENLEVARSIVAISFPPERRQEMMDKTMASVVRQMRAGMGLGSITDPGLRKIIDNYLESVPALLRPATSAFLPKQMDAIATAYARMFTLQELKDIEAFAHTPSGMAFLQRNIEVLQDPAVAAVNTDYFRQVTQISEQGGETLKEQVTEYLKQHPEAIPKQPARK